MGVNHDGEIVGWATTASGAEDAVVWIGGHPTVLGPGQANAVNGQGKVVGSSDGNAVMWKGGEMTTLLPDGSANAVSPTGVVVGECLGIHGGYTRPFLVRGGLVTYPPQVVPSSSAQGINAAGDIVGFVGYYGTAVEWIPATQ